MGINRSTPPRKGPRGRRSPGAQHITASRAAAVGALRTGQRSSVAALRFLGCERAASRRTISTELFRTR